MSARFKKEKYNQYHNNHKVKLAQDYLPSITSQIGYLNGTRSKTGLIKKHYLI